MLELRAREVPSDDRAEPWTSPTRSRRWASRRPSRCRGSSSRPRPSRRCRNGLRVVVVPRPGVPLVELRLRVPFAAPHARGRPHRPRRACSPARCCSARPSTTRPSIAAAAAGARRRAVGVHRPRPAARSATTMLPDGLARLLGLLAELLEPRHLPRRPGRGRAGPGRRADRDRRAPSRRHRPHGAGRPPLRQPPVRASSCPTPDAGRRRRPPRAAPAARASGCCRPAASLVLVGDLDPGARPPTRSPRRSPAGRGERTGRRGRRRPRAAAAARIAARRPARRRAVQHPARRPGARPRRRPTTRRCGWPTWSSAATSPRGWSRTSASDGLHLQPAQPVDHRRGRLPARRRGRRRHRGHRRRRCWRPGTSSAAWRPRR